MEYAPLRFDADGSTDDAKELVPGLHLIRRNVKRVPDGLWMADQAHESFGEIVLCVITQREEPSPGTTIFCPRIIRSTAV